MRLLLHVPTRQHDGLARPRHRRWRGTSRWLAAGVITAVTTAICGCAVPGAQQSAAPNAAAPNPATAAPAATSTDPASPEPGDATATAAVPSLAPAEASIQQAMPGLYGFDSFDPTITPGGLTFSTAAPCSDLVAVLRGGQWSLTVVHQPADKNQHTWMGVLRKGTHRALVTLSGGAGGCSGSIVHDRPVTVSASGAVRSQGSANYLSLLCSSLSDGSGSGSDASSAPGSDTASQEFLMGLYFAGHHAYLVDGALPTKPGTYHITAAGIAATGSGDGDGDATGFGVAVLPPNSNPLPSLITSLGAMFYPMDLTGSQSGPSSPGAILARYPAYAGGPRSTETVTITGEAPLAGTISGSALANQQHPSSPALTFSAPFECDR